MSKPHFKSAGFGTVVDPKDFTCHRVRLWTNGETFTLHTASGRVEVLKLFQIRKKHEATQQ